MQEVHKTVGHDIKLIITELCFSPAPPFLFVDSVCFLWIPASPLSVPFRLCGPWTLLRFATDCYSVATPCFGFSLDETPSAVPILYSAAGSVSCPVTRFRARQAARPH